MVVVDLEEGPSEHFLRQEEVVDVGDGMVFTGVAGAVWGEGEVGGGVVGSGGPEVCT